MTLSILTGCCLAVLATLPDRSVDCCITSPPYWGLRDYQNPGQLGLEPTPEEYVANMVRVFREVRRVLKDDGTLWLNLGDSYASAPGGFQGKNGQRRDRTFTAKVNLEKRAGDLKPKDLVGIPWRVAFALQSDGWYLRQDIIWSKPNPMPESVRDRCTKSHEYIFLLSKNERYYFDPDAIAEPLAASSIARLSQANLPNQLGSDRVPGKTNGTMKAVVRSGNKERKSGTSRGCPEGTGSNVCGSVPWEGSKRNKRSVWSVSTKPFKEAHFATFPPELIEPCVLAGCPQGGTVIDPFFGAGTTGLVAQKHGRNCIGIELNPDYVEIARKRVEDARSLQGDLFNPAA
jgi:DNA modification methylase